MNLPLRVVKDPAKTRIEESDKQLAEAMRTEINDVLKAIESSGAEPSSDQLKQVVNNMKALCRSGIEYYQKQLPSSDDAFTQDALKNIQVLKNSNMLIQEFQERDGSDVGAKIAFINVLNQSGIKDTIVFEGVTAPDPKALRMILIWILNSKLVKSNHH